MPHHRTRRLLVTIAGSGLGLALSVPELPAGVRSIAGPDLADALAGVTVLALAALSLWLLVASVLVALALSTGAGTGLARRVAPTWLAATLSTGALLLAPGAQATPADLDGLPMPDRAPVTAVAGPAVDAPPPSEAAALPAPSVPGRTVVVHAGDCLWELARQHAPGAASDLDVARLTQAWHETNRAVIGPDPDLLHPGQVLAIPTDDQVIR